MTEERVYELNANQKGKLDKVLKKDPYADLSFAKQGYKLKEGKAVGGEEGKLYVYLSGGEEFFKHAEEKLKGAELEEFKRCESELEGKIIKQIHEEDSSAEQGMGAIFG